MKNSKKLTIILALIFAIGFVSTFGFSYMSLFYPSADTTIATIMIDPGHGGNDPGAIGYDGSYEKDINLAISLKVGSMIHRMDPRIKVVYTHTNDMVDWPETEKENLYYRILEAQEQEADYYLSIHCNSNQDELYKGYYSYIRINDKASQRISHSISDNLKKVHWSNNQGIRDTNEYPLYVVDNQDIPVLLFEVGFMTNPKECKKMKRWYNQELIAYAIAKGYVDYIEKNEG